MGSKTEDPPQIICCNRSRTGPQALEDRNAVRITFIDFQKAFNTTVSPLTPIAVKDCSAYKSCDDSMNDGIMQHALSKLCERFQELATLDLTRCDLIDWFDGICNIYLDADTFANVEKLLQNITYSCNSIKHTALLFDAKLAWSSLPMKEMRLLYRYLVSSIFNVPPDLDLVAISPKAKHMGRQASFHPYWLCGVVGMKRPIRV
ncbi:unnamed protein product [Schistocephalus solidus]|uniref:Reverse transcriptase domain-containing protein n=1 Tax=Schistocephalus solidus TaxID=70667 RepID=A0A183SSQ1_SCHSO|nr:unnamed protein product [Schistocephalus solidus]